MQGLLLVPFGGRELFEQGFPRFGLLFAQVMVESANDLVGVA